MIFEMIHWSYLILAFLIGCIVMASLLLRFVFEVVSRYIEIQNKQDEDTKINVTIGKFTVLKKDFEAFTKSQN